MAIHAPRRRLLRTVGLQFVRSGLVAGRRSVSAGLSLTSMIDFLVVTVVFLLMSFSATGECACRRQVDVPVADHGTDMIDAVIVSVSNHQVFVDGVAAGDVGPTEDSTRVQRVDAVFNVLKAKRELWGQLYPGKAFPGVVLLEMDANVPALIVKSVFQTAALAGYPNESFLVSASAKAR
jgi:hypothetical protein